METRMISYLLVDGRDLVKVSQGQEISYLLDVNLGVGLRQSGSLPDASFHHGGSLLVSFLGHHPHLFPLAVLDVFRVMVSNFRSSSWY